MTTECKKLLSKGTNSRLEPRNAKSLAETKDCCGENPDSAESANEKLNILILADMPNLYKFNGASMSQSFIKQIISDNAKVMRSQRPWAYLLLGLIAERVNRSIKPYDGMEQGEAYIGDWMAIGASRQNYRSALLHLVRTKNIIIIETNRTRKKSTTGSTTEGTKVKLLSSDIYEVFYETPNHRPNHCPTTDQPLTNHDLEYKNSRRIEEDIRRSSSSSGGVGDGENEKKRRIFSKEERKKETIEMGWTSEEFEEGWQRYLKQPDGKVKTFHGWFYKVMESIRMEFQKRDEIKKTNDEIQQKAEEKLKFFAETSRLTEEDRKREEAELREKIKEKNEKYLEEFQNNHPEKVKFKGRMFRFVTGEVGLDCWFYIDEPIEPCFKMLVEETFKKIGT